MIGRVQRYPRLRRKFKTSDITNNHTPFDVVHAIDMFVTTLDGQSEIELKEKNALQCQCEGDMNEAEFLLGFEIPADDSESDFSDSSSSETDVCNTSNLVGSRKSSFVRRLERKLKFLLLPSSTGQLPPFAPIIVKKNKLILYFVAAGIDPDVYRLWIVPLLKYTTELTL